MGNSQSQTISESSVKKENLFETINAIATKYILTQDFQDMKKLVSDQEYCDNLVILTTKIIQEHINIDDITYMKQKTRAGEIVDELEKDKVAYFEKPLSKYDVSNSINKFRMCKGIAKFYIQIANLFAAITMTLNPMFIYVNDSGEEIKLSLDEKNKIPKGVDVKIVYNNMCQKRLDILSNGNDEYIKNNGIDKFNKKDKYIINPNFCDMNITPSGSVKKLKKVTGISELKKLYYDDYDYNIGEFKNMSPLMRKKYEEDLITFYKAFTGENKFPVDNATGESSIKDFRDIQLRNYASLTGCKKGEYKKSIEDTLGNGLFNEYAKNISSMINSAQESQDKLSNILSQVFVHVDSKESSDNYMINSKLDQKKLDNLIQETKDIILNMYTTCEKQFYDGLSIYEAIVKQQILLTTQSQLKDLNTKLSPVNNDQANVDEPRQSPSLPRDDVQLPLIDDKVEQPPVQPEPLPDNEIEQPPVQPEPLPDNEIEQSPVKPEPLPDNEVEQPPVHPEPLPDNEIEQPPVQPPVQSPVQPPDQPPVQPLPLPNDEVPENYQKKTVKIQSQNAGKRRKTKKNTKNKIVKKKHKTKKTRKGKK
jgi:hypothetical protein